MLDTVGLPEYFWVEVSPTGPGYLKDLPEAIKAHLARTRAAKPTGVERISECEFRIVEFSEVSRMANCGLTISAPEVIPG